MCHNYVNVPPTHDDDDDISIRDYYDIPSNIIESIGQAIIDSNSRDDDDDEDSDE